MPAPSTNEERRPKAPIDDEFERIDPAFVEIESYESLRHKAEQKDRAIFKLNSRIKERDERIQ